jgi:hypothetical protein
MGRDLKCSRRSRRARKARRETRPEEGLANTLSEPPRGGLEYFDRRSAARTSLQERSLVTDDASLAVLLEVEPSSSRH